MKKNSLEDILLPPLPDALIDVRRELGRDEPDIDVIGAAIVGDASLSSQVLKVVNSPGFGRTQKISSIPTAIMMLGLKNVLNIANGVALRAAMEGRCNRPLDRFWDSAADVALVSAILAGELTGIPQDMAYTLGLMHDCGIPVLMCGDAEYAAAFAAAQRCSHGVELTRRERAICGLDHATVGAHVVRHWYLPDEIVLAIRAHHGFAELLAADDAPVGETVLTLIGILKMGEHVSNVFRGLAFRGLDRDEEWEAVGELVLAYFGIDQDDFEDRTQMLLGVLGQR